MRWLDILLGRTRLVKSHFEKLFAMSTAQVTLQVKFTMNPTGNAAITFRPVESSGFAAAESELERLLQLTAGETGTEFRHVKDSYGFQWVLLFDRKFEDLVAAMHMASQTLQEHGFGDQMLVALFEFSDGGGRRIYWIYNYKRGSFYPLVPLEGRKRDNAYELRLRAAMEKEMPVEPEIERWYPLWDVPFTRERVRPR